MTNVRVLRNRNRVLIDTYADARLDQTCPNCQAPPGDWCEHPDGYYRRTPCIARIHRNTERPPTPLSDTKTRPR